MSGSTLHITNGDGAAGVIRESAVDGEVLPWRDPMHHGPFPSGLSLDERANVRADYLAEPDMSTDPARREFALRNQHLKDASRYDEIVLWFEHDLLDQLQLVEILEWMSQAETALPPVTLICIKAFEGVENFRGLGQLNPGQIATLHPKRKPVSSRQLETAKLAWAAFTAREPTAVFTFLKTDGSALPFLHAALYRHLEELAWTSDGLSRTERQILKLIADGEPRPGQVFVKNMEQETVLYEGDWRTFSHIAELCSGETPLLRSSPHETFLHPREDIPMETFRAQRLSLTPDGHDVLSGRQHANDLMHRDMWLGGVHVTSENAMWMWDAEKQEPILANQRSV